MFENVDAQTNARMHRRLDWYTISSPEASRRPLKLENQQSDDLATWHEASGIQSTKFVSMMTELTLTNSIINFNVKFGQICFLCLNCLY